MTVEKADELSVFEELSANDELSELELSDLLSLYDDAVDEMTDTELSTDDVLSIGTFSVLTGSLHSCLGAAENITTAHNKTVAPEVQKFSALWVLSLRFVTIAFLMRNAA